MTDVADLDPFDTLPVHPRPYRLESFTGYLTRMGEVNHIKSLYGLSALLFPDVEPRTIRRSADYPPPSFGLMPARLACPEEALLAATFHHLGQAFGRSTQPQPLSRFLSHSIAPHLRFCPECLVSPGYRLLTWRFLLLGGCSIHHCRLLDCCPHCGRRISLLAAPPHVCLCPHCKGDLREGERHPLNGDELRLAEGHSQDLAFLLSSLPATPPMPSARALGQVIMSHRHHHRLSLADVAHRAAISPSKLRAIELGTLERGAVFQDYVLYAGLLGTSLEALLNEAMQRGCGDPAPSDVARRSRQRTQRYAELVEQANRLPPDTLDRLRRGFELGQSDQELADVVEVDRRMVWAVRRHWGLAGRWRQLKEERQKADREVREQRLVQSVQRAVTALQNNKQVITLGRIAALVGLSPAGLVRYSQVNSALEGADAIHGSRLRKRRPRR